MKKTIAALPPGIAAPDFCDPPDRARLVRSIVDHHWQCYIDSHTSCPPRLYDEFRRTPDFTLLGRFDAANLDEETHALVTRWSEEGQRRRWDATPEHIKRKCVSPEEFEKHWDDMLDAGLLDPGDDEDEEEDDRDDPDFQPPYRPPVLTMDQMRYLLYRESQGDTTLRDYLASSSTL